MAAIEKIFLDRRLFVDGKKSWLFLDNSFSLHDYIVDIININNNSTGNPVTNLSYSGTDLTITLKDGTDFTTTMDPLTTNLTSSFTIDGNIYTSADNLSDVLNALNAYIDSISGGGGSSHNPVTLNSGSNPALSISSQELSLNLSFPGSFTPSANPTWTLSSDNIEGAINELAGSSWKITGNTVGFGVGTYRLGFNDPAIITIGGAGNAITIDQSDLLNFGMYLDSRDDSGTYSPFNFLYTDNSGNLLSSPISYLPFSPVLKHYAEPATSPSNTPAVHSLAVGGFAIGDSAYSSSMNMISLGYNAGAGSNTGQNAIFIGAGAGQSTAGADSSIFLGFLAGQYTTNAKNNIFIGKYSGSQDTVSNGTNDFSILLGNYIKTGGFKNSVLIGSGTSGSYDQNTAANQFRIAPIMTNFSIRNINYVWPNSQASSANMVLTNDGSGNLSWADHILKLYKESYTSGAPVATGSNSIAIGYAAETLAPNSIALGGRLNVGGEESVSIGYGSIVGAYSAAAILGVATAPESFAIKGTAYGNRSFALGADARSYLEIAMGYNPTSYTAASTSTYNLLDRLFVIGNGSSYASDALTLLKNGQLGLSINNYENTSTRRSEKLFVNGYQRWAATSINSSTTLSASTLKQIYYIDTTSGNINITLPASNTLGDGSEITFINSAGSNTITFIGSGSDTVNGSASYVFTAGTSKAIKLYSDGTSAWCIFLDISSSTTTTPLKIIQTTTANTVTGTTSPTILQSLLIPAGKISLNDIIVVESRISKTAVSTGVLNIYINSSLSLTGATLIATLSLAAATLSSTCSRRLASQNNTWNWSAFTTANANNTSDYNSTTTAPSVVAYDFSSGVHYIILSVTPAASGLSISSDFLQLKINSNG